MTSSIGIDKDVLNGWAESLIHMNHLGTLVKRELAEGNIERANHLAERARKRAWAMFNELIIFGADKPDGFCEAASDTTEISNGSR